MSLEPLLEVFTTAGTMGLAADGGAAPGQCWGTLGDTGSILTMAGAEPRHWDRTTTGRGHQDAGSVTAQGRREGEVLPGWLWSRGCRPCRMRVLAAAGLWLTGREATQSGLGWIGGLVLRMVLAFRAELGRTGGRTELIRRLWSPGRV